MLGLVSTKTAELEAEDALCARIRDCSRYVDLERLAISPQCGFSSSDKANKVMSHEQGVAKLERVVEVARRMWPRGMRRDAEMTCRLPRSSRSAVAFASRRAPPRGRMADAADPDHRAVDAGRRGRHVCAAARRISQPPLLPQPFVVDNRAGGGGLIGAAAAAHAEPDGYTFVTSSVAYHAIAPAVSPNPGFDPIRDFTHVAYLGGPPNVFIVQSRARRAFAQGAGRACARAGRPLDYVSPGVGTLGHLLVEYFAQRPASSCSTFRTRARPRP